MSASYLKQAAEKVELTSFLSYREYLAALFRFLKESVPDYSFVRFAEDLGFPPTNYVRLIIVGKRALSRKGAQRVITALGLTGSFRRYLFALVGYNNARLPAAREEFFAELLRLKGKNLPTVDSQFALEYYAEWCNPVIREMTAMPDFKSDPDWIAGKLFARLLPKEIKHSLELLEKLGLVTFDSERNRHTQTGGAVSPAREVEKMAGIRYHQKVLEMAKDSISLVSEDRRDMNAMTLCLSADQFEEIKKKIWKLFEEVVEMEKSGNQGNAVYQLNVQLFPFTKC